MIEDKFIFKIDFVFSGIQRSSIPEFDDLRLFRFTRESDYLVGGVLNIFIGDKPMIIDSTGSPGVSDYFWTPLIRILENAIPAIVEGTSIQVDLYDNPHNLTFVPTYGEDLFIYFISAVPGTDPYSVCHIRKTEFFRAIFECAENTQVSIIHFDPEMESSEMMTDLRSALSKGRARVMTSRYN